MKYVAVDVVMQGGRKCAPAEEQTVLLGAAAWGGL